MYYFSSTVCIHCGGLGRTTLNGVSNFFFLSQHSIYVCEIKSVFLPEEWNSAGPRTDQYVKFSLGFLCVDDVVRLRVEPCVCVCG